jgi:hypothetical protein
MVSETNFSILKYYIISVIYYNNENTYKKEVLVMKPTVYGIEKFGLDPESDVDIVLW